MANALRIEPGRMRIGNGKFDTNNRYIRRVAVSSNKIMSLPRGPSIAIAVTSGTEIYISFRWQVGPATFTFNNSAPAYGFNAEVPVAL